MNIGKVRDVALAVVSRNVVELNACGPDDPDGARASAILGAYFEAEHALAFRRLLWRRLAILAVAWGFYGAFLRSGGVLIDGLFLIAVAAGYAVALEWRAKSRLDRLIERDGTSRSAEWAARSGQSHPLDAVQSSSHAAATSRSSRETSCTVSEPLSGIRPSLHR